MKKYTAYKDSGIEWIGKIPNEWQTKRLKYGALFCNGYAFDSDEYSDDGIPIMRIGDVKECIDLNGMKRVPKEYERLYHSFGIQYGDILLALTGATIGKSFIFNLKEKVLLNQRVAIVRPRKYLHSGFLKHLIACDGFKKHIDLECAGGAQENIGKEEIGNFLVPLPSYDKQENIANFLNRKILKISELIAKKDRMIELLKEERTAVINQTVTKGLSPRFMFDTNIFDKILSVGGNQYQKIFDSCSIFITHLQKDQIEAIDDMEKKQSLLSLFNKVNVVKISTSLAVYGVSRYGEARYSNPEDIQIYREIARKNKAEDALIAETARVNDLVLVTEDKDLFKTIQKMGGKVADFQDFISGNHFEMKDSGVEWLGKIPKHWKVKKIKYVARVNQLALGEETEEAYEFNYIDIGNVDLEMGYSITDKISFVSAPSRARRIVRKGDTIVSTVRTYLKAIAHIGEVVNDFIVSTGFAVVTPASQLEPKFVYYILRSEKMIDRICAVSVGVSYPAINSSDLADMAIWYPEDKNEQKYISDYLDNFNKQTNIVMNNLAREIALLKEYRIALISEVVTGKIDVRN